MLYIDEFRNFSCCIITQVSFLINSFKMFEDEKFYLKSSKMFWLIDHLSFSASCRSINTSYHLSFTFHQKRFFVLNWLPLYTYNKDLKQAQFKKKPTLKAKFIMQHSCCGFNKVLCHDMLI